ncbi:MAG: hypothetical protein PHC70_02790 [Patescibacteria group bacterium]|nr:hypothetical protein [Patescibacteria group bacterium]
MSWLNKERIAISILAAACLILVASMGWNWYHNKKDYFLSGSPPQDVLEKIEPKKVPYEQIKPPAFLATDALVIGSISSTIGISFYGDYADPQSNALARELENWARNQQGKVRFVWYYLPATTDDNDISFESAVFSECSRLIDDMWQAHLLMLSVPKVDKRTMEMFSQQLETSEKLLYNCRSDKNIRDYLKQKIYVARGDGIDKAPFVFVGTQVFPAQSASSSSIIRSALTHLRY